MAIYHPNFQITLLLMTNQFSCSSLIICYLSDGRCTIYLKSEEENCYEDEFCLSNCSGGYYRITFFTVCKWYRPRLNCWLITSSRKIIKKKECVDMKKFMLISLSLLVSLSLLTGCGKKKEKTNTGDNQGENSSVQTDIKVSTNEGIIGDKQVETLKFEIKSLKSKNKIKKQKEYILGLK